MFLSKYSLDRNNTIASLFRTQFNPDFWVAEYYGLRNTIFWWSKDLASESSRICYFLGCFNCPWPAVESIFNLFFHSLQ
jgi:hypothetical protein